MTLEPYRIAVAEKEEDREVSVLGEYSTDSADFLDYASRAQAHAMLEHAVQQAHRTLFGLLEGVGGFATLASSVSLRSDPFCRLLNFNPGSSRWPELFNRLTELSALKADWDPEGAAPPNARTVAMARSFLNRLLYEEFAPNSISPSVEEGIAFNFRSGPKYAAVEFLNDGSIGLVLSEPGKEPVVDCLEAEAGTLHEAVKRLREFIG